MLRHEVYNAPLLVLLFTPVLKMTLLEMKPVFAEEFIYLHMRKKLVCSSFQFFSSIIVILYSDS